MIRNLLSKLFNRKRAGGKLLTSHKRHRRIAIEPLETRRLLAATGSISGYVYLDPANAGQMSSGDQGFAGMTVELESVGRLGGHYARVARRHCDDRLGRVVQFLGRGGGDLPVADYAVAADSGHALARLGGRDGRHERNPIDARRRAGGHRLQLRPARRSRTTFRREWTWQRPERWATSCQTRC